MLSASTLVMTETQRQSFPEGAVGSLKVPVQAASSSVLKTDSRNVKTSRGWVQGYNAQAVCTEDRIVIAAEVTVDSAGLRSPRADARKRGRARPGWDGGPYAFMRRVLATEHGGALYANAKA